MANVGSKLAPVKPIHARSIKSARSAVRRAPSKTISPIVQHALAVVGRRLAEKSRDRLKPGLYEVNETVQVVGVLSVGKDTEARVEVGPPHPASLLAVAFHLMSDRQRNRLVEKMQDWAIDSKLRAKGASEVAGRNAMFVYTHYIKYETQKRRGAVSGDLAVHAQ